MAFMKISSLLFFLFLSGCVSTGTKQLLPGELASTDACFALYDLKNAKLVDQVGLERCQARRPACSTFKIPLAVMALDYGTVKNAATKLKWDGQKRMLDAWNRDHTAASWMKESVVWYSQQLTKKLGRNRVQGYLRKFNYGNADFSGGLENAWLTPSPFMTTPPKTSLEISPLEQIEFMKALYSDRLPVSLKAMAAARSLLPCETSPGGAVLCGKTGSGFQGESATLRLGWYVAHLRKGEEEYVAVVSYDDRIPVPNASFGGALARDSMKKLLAERGLW